ncbi:MAG: asparaginase, partial [Heliobacteriaceae bacterium]|nr:asparaginase [Heliobacteriaceae bacterium]
MVENRRRGAIVVVDVEGRRVAGYGKPETTYMRSSAKPLMQLVLVESGGFDHFGLQEEHLAVFVGSHTGEEPHRYWVADGLAKIGLTEAALLCGTHTPFDRKTATALVQAGQKPTVLHCNCSGKHTGVLAYTRYRGYDVSTYIDPQNPAEVEIIAVVADMAGIAPADIVIGIDGCNIPVFGLPLENMALSFARFGAANYGSAARREACRRVAGAMVNHPFLVGGTGRLDTDLLQVTRGKVIPKIGADGIYCLAVPEKGLGLALKIEDGNMRALGPVVIEALNQLGILTAAERQALAGYEKITIKNNVRKVVGELRPVFTLEG